MIYKDIGRYQGKWKDGLYDGKGFLKWTDFVYKGEFKKGLKHG